MVNERMRVIRGGRVLDVDRIDAPAADILIEGNTIREVGAPGMAVPSSAEVVDASGMLLHPGLINAHTHGHGSLGKGCGDCWTLELLLTAGPWLSGGRRLEDRYLASALNAAENLLKGCTACYDLFMELPVPTVEGVELATQAYLDAGMRVVMAPMMADINLYDAVPGLRDALPEHLKERVDAGRPQPWKQTIAVIEALAHRWSRPIDRASLALAPTIPLHCSDEFLKGVAALAAETGMLVHSHVAESKVQALAGLDRYGQTLVAHIARLGLVNERFTVAHGVWLTGEDMAQLAGAGASVAANPGSNMRLGNGLPDIRSMLDAGVNVAVGTDGSNSSDNQNMYEATRLAAFASRVCSPDPERWVRAVEAFEAATVGGARALGLDRYVGRISPGYQADLVFVDLGHINWLPTNVVINQLVNTEDASAVRHVMVAGDWSVRDRTLVRLDLGRLRDQAAEAKQRLEVATQEARALGRELESIVAGYCPGLAASRPYHVHRYCGPTGS